MSISLFRITQFGSQVLHNGTTHYATRYIENPLKAKLDIIELPNGALFDPNGSGAAATTPQPFESPHLIKLTAPAAASTELAAIKALVGTRGTLTASPYDGSANQTCTARLERIDATQPEPIDTPNTVLRLALRFVPLGDWA
jgi:hypothetical protein